MPTRKGRSLLRVPRMTFNLTPTSMQFTGRSLMDVSTMLGLPESSPAHTSHTLSRAYTSAKRHVVGFLGGPIQHGRQSLVRRRYRIPQRPARRRLRRRADLSRLCRDWATRRAVRCRHDPDRSVPTSVDHEPRALLSGRLGRAASARAQQEIVRHALGDLAPHLGRSKLFVCSSHGDPPPRV